jgi:DNA polymerase-1
MAMNSPIQGSAADIIKLAMLKVDRALKEAGLKAKLLLQVHDELVLEVPREELAATGEVVRAEMENAVELAVPLLVEVKVGENWRDCEALKTR